MFVPWLAVRSLPERLEVWGLRKVKLGKSERPYKPSPAFLLVFTWVACACLCLDDKRESVFQEDTGRGFLEPGRRKWECTDSGDAGYSCSPEDTLDRVHPLSFFAHHPPARPPASTSGVSLLLLFCGLVKHLKLVEHCFDSVQYFKEGTTESRWWHQQARS